MPRWLKAAFYRRSRVSFEAGSGKAPAIVDACHSRRARVSGRGKGNHLLAAQAHCRVDCLPLAPGGALPAMTMVQGTAVAEAGRDTSLFSGHNARLSFLSRACGGTKDEGVIHRRI